MELLADILAQKAAEVRALRAQPSPTRPVAWEVRDVPGALRRSPGQPLRLIAEVKFRSPSAGPLSRALSAGARALAYQRGGAAMISVLTDARWFDGCAGDLADARAEVHTPLLCKDFIIDPVQLAHAWAQGADAALLIVRCLPVGARLGELMAAARERGMEPFVEVVDEVELGRALDAGARVVGINARDLNTLEMDSARAGRILALVPREVVAVHLSGVKAPAQARAIAATRADAALIGEALMRQDDPLPLLGSMLSAVG